MKLGIISPLRWLQSIGDPVCAVHFDLKGFPMFFDARPGWIANTFSPDQHIVYFCLGGSFQTEINSRSFTVRPGEMMWVQPGVPFKFYINPRESAHIARFRLRLTRRPGQPLRLREKFFYLQRAGSARAWLDQIRLFANAANEWAEQGRRAALAGFFATILEIHARQNTDPSHARSLTPTQLARLGHFVELRGSCPCTPSDLAAHLQLAPAYFNRLFRATLGCSARAWLIDRRIHAAAQQLVESNRRVSEVADEFGYTSLFFFSRQFRKILGVSPRAFRQKALAGNK